MMMNLFLALPEIFLLVMIIVILLSDAFIGGKNKSINTVLTLLTLVAAFFLQLFVDDTQLAKFAFNNMFILDSITRGMSLFTYFVAIIIVLYSRQYINDKKLLKGEFYAIFLFAVFGMLIMIAAYDLLILYIGLELLSLALYGLVAINRDNPRGAESAMKFFILSALASGVLLYGISFIYGATGQLQLNEVFSFLYHGNANANAAILVFGLVFIVAGLMFKLGLVPFHMWVPDVYEGASLPVTMIIGTVTKLAAVVFLVRFLIGGLVLLNKDWSVMLLVLAYLSLFVGNIAAITQTNIKRMLGYSTVAQMAFIALGLMTVSVDGIASMFFYIIAYVTASLAAFGVLLLLSRDNYECEKIDDLKGLSRTHPIYAAVLLLVMFSFAGIPPLVGFYAKFKILTALVAHGYIRTAIYAVIMSLIGTFYYLRIIKVMYFDNSEAELRVSDASILSRGLLVLNGLVLVVLGLLPMGLMNYCVMMIRGG